MRTVMSTFVIGILVFLTNYAKADTDYQAIIENMDLFLLRQMYWFDYSRLSGQPPLVQTFGWNTSLSFPPAQLNPPPQVHYPYAPKPSEELPYRGDIYDQSLASIWFTERGRLDFLHGRDPSANLAVLVRCSTLESFLASMILIQTCG